MEFKWLADWALDTFAPVSEKKKKFAMQMSVQDSFGYTNVYVCCAK